MSTLVKNLVCFLSPGEPSGTSLLSLLNSLSIKPDRLFFVSYPSFNKAATGYKLESYESHVLINLEIEQPNKEQSTSILQALITKIFYELNIDDYLIWCDTTKTASWSSHLFPVGTVLCCNDLSPSYSDDPYVEKQLRSADVLITTGYSCYSFAKGFHDHVFQITRAIDVDHFYESRYYKKDPIDQVTIPHPRIGYFGDLGDQFDHDLLMSLASLRPHWHFILTEDSSGLSKQFDLSNVHHLGYKSYGEIPDYISGWDVGILPFHLDRARLLNPPQCSQFVIAGKPVVSTPLPDVIRLYAQKGIVHVASTDADFASKIQLALQSRHYRRLNVGSTEFVHEQRHDERIKKLKEYLHTQFTFSGNESFAEKYFQRMGYSIADKA